MSKSCWPNPQGPLFKQLPSSCIESANNYVEKMTKHTIAEGSKGRKGGLYKSCLVSYSSHYTSIGGECIIYGTSPIPTHMQLWAERHVNCPHWCCGAVVITKKCGDHEILSWKFSIMGFSAISRNFEPRKFGAIRYYWKYDALVCSAPYCSIELALECARAG